MPARSAEEKAERKLLLQQKREARALQKQQKEQLSAGAPVAATTISGVLSSASKQANALTAGHASDKTATTTTTTTTTGSKTKVTTASSVASSKTLYSSDNTSAQLVHLPEVALHYIMAYMSARDLGCWIMTCQSFRHLLLEARVHHLLTRLRHTDSTNDNHNCKHHNHHHHSPKLRFQLLENESQVHTLLQQSLKGGNTGRVIVKKKKHSPPSCDEFIAYARFLEEIVCGYATLQLSQQQQQQQQQRAPRRESSVPLPHFVQGRFVSVSPEHSLCRVGGDGQYSGAGGSGVASWGVGKRGQLGHGQRQDVALPKRLLGGLGYGNIRIVQVSAGGGLVRVAHSLLLTSTGKVLSFGTGQYGALGHGYNAGKQLPDTLRPQYIKSLLPVTCICVAAGELHSAVVTSDGDVYTWGDGFCGQLGHADKRPRVVPKQVTTGGLQDECICNISCGSRHTLAISEDGECWSWGLGHFGVLGRSYTPFDYDADTAIESFQQQQQGIVIPPPAQANVPEEEEASALELHAAIMDAAADYVSERQAAAAAASRADQDSNYDGDDEVAPEAAAALIAHIANMANLDSITNLSLDDSSDQCIPKVVDSLQGIKVIGASAGHRHSLLLDETGVLYSFGSGSTGCLGHGTMSSEMHPVRIMQFVNEQVQIAQMSAGVDISMAVSTTGNVYSWGKTQGGRIGLPPSHGNVLLPRKVQIGHHEEIGSTSAATSAAAPIVKAVDVECGYVHSIIVGLDGSIHMCGGVGVDGEDDGQREEVLDGLPRQVPDFNIWHRLPEPQNHAKTERWKKYGKYEVKGRSKMLAETYDHHLK